MKSNSRYLGALVLAPLVIFIFLGGIWLKGLIAFLSILGMYEFYKVIKVKEMKPVLSMGYILLFCYYLSNNNFKILSYIIIIGMAVLLCFPVINTKYTFIDSAMTMLGFVYVGVFFSLIFLVNEMKSGNYLVWIIFLASFGCDTCAYYSGKYLGKHKLCPKVSPKKTIEGSLGGMIGSAIICGIFGFAISKYSNVNIMPIWNYVLIGLICGGFSQFGDLVASSIKRYAGVKDYSNLIPGHGGILDRFDSILFSSIVVYFYLTVVFIVIK